VLFDQRPEGFRDEELRTTEIASVERYPGRLKAEGPDHRGGHAPQRPHAGRVRGGLAQRPRREGHRFARRQAGDSPGVDRGSRHGADVDRADRAARVLHRVRSDDGVVHDSALVRRLLEEETEDIIKLGSFSGEAAARYRKASKIAAQWIRNFRSLGSYTRNNLT